MTKKDFALVARVIQQVNREQQAAHAHTSGCVCLQMAYALAQRFPKFHREAFLAACLPPEEACELFKGRKFYCANCGQSRTYHN